MSETRLITAVHTATRVLSNATELNEELRRTLEVAMEAVNAQGGSIFLHDSAKGELQFRHVVGEKAGELIGSAVPDNAGIAGQVFQTGKPVIENDTSTNPQYNASVANRLRFEVRNLVTTPLCFPGGVTIGVIQLINKKEGDFTEEDLMVLDIIGSVSAMTIHANELSEQNRRSAVLHHVGGVAHDIKNKAFIIQIGLETLKPVLNDLFERIAGQMSPEEVDRIRQEIDAGLEDINSNIDDVFRYTKFMADMTKGNNVDVRRETMDLVLPATRSLGGLQQRAAERKVSLRAEYSEPVECSIDAFLIERAVFNLVNNAIPETPEGGTVTVAIYADGTDAVLEVRDTGRGMPAHILRSILVGAATSTKAGGTGLGTMVVKMVAELHNGRFEGESREGHGTTFRLRIPR